MYVMRSLKTGQCYMGYTTDFERRLCEHNNGGSKATKNRGPYELIYYEAYSHRDDALVRETSLKRYPNVGKHLKNRLFRTLARASSRPKEVVG